MVCTNMTESALPIMEKNKVLVSMQFKQSMKTEKVDYGLAVVADSIGSIMTGL